MKILALDTSSTVAGASVLEDDRVLGEYLINSGMQHSVKLMPMVKSLLEALNLKPSDLDVFAVSTGPGSFTGLRIGITAVKAMAYALSKPVAGIPTLDALAYNMYAFDGVICPIMDARNNQVYTALYRWKEGKLTKLTDYMALSIYDLAEKLKTYGENIVFNGDAMSLHKSFFTESLGERAFFAPANLSLQRASSIAHLANQKAKEKKLETGLELIPFYLRKSQAEQQYEKSKNLWKNHE